MQVEQFIGLQVEEASQIAMLQDILQAYQTYTQNTLCFSLFPNRPSTNFLFFYSLIQSPSTTIPTTSTV